MKINKILLSTALIILLSSMVVLSATVTGKVMDIKQQPLESKKMVLKGTDSLFPLETLTGKDGSFKFDNVTQGEWVLTLTDPKLDSYNVEIIIESADAVTEEYEVYAWENMVLKPNVLKIWKRGFQNSVDEKNADEEAIADLIKVTEKKPDFFPAYAKLGKIYYEKGEYDKALPVLKKALEINPYFPQSNQLIARIYEEKDKHKESVAHYQKVSLAQPCDAELAYNMANKYYRLKDYNSSKKYYNRAVRYYGEGNKQAAMAFFFLADSYLKSKEYKNAIDPFENFLKLAPNHTYAKDAKRILNALKKKFKNEK